MTERDSTRDLLAALALAALAWLVFAPVTGFAFLNFDDDLYVTENAHVRAGLTWDTVRWAFSSAETGHYHPLTWLSHALDVEWFGLEAGAHHRTGLLLHGVGAALCFLAWRRLGIRFDVAALAGALFAVHPLRLESVAWVATRKDVLSGVFFFLALLAWASWLERRQPWRLALTTALFAVALLAKPTVLPLPLLLLVLDRWPLARTERLASRVLEKAPLFIVAAVFAVVAVVSQRGAGTMPSVDAIPVGDRFANASVALVTNVGRLLWPVEVSLFHPLRPLPVGLGVACALGLVAVTGWAARARSSVAMAWWWFLLLLLPVSGLFQIGGQLVADRWMFHVEHGPRSHPANLDIFARMGSTVLEVLVPPLAATGPRRPHPRLLSLATPCPGPGRGPARTESQRPGLRAHEVDGLVHRARSTPRITPN
jgi:protein O-mannosyl-transferase